MLMLWIHPSSGKHDDVHISKYHQRLDMLINLIHIAAGDHIGASSLFPSDTMSFSWSYSFCKILWYSFFFLPLEIMLMSFFHSTSRNHAAVTDVCCLSLSCCLGFDLLPKALLISLIPTSTSKHFYISDLCCPFSHVSTHDLTYTKF